MGQTQAEGYLLSINVHKLNSKFNRKLDKTTKIKDNTLFSQISRKMVTAIQDFCW